MNQSDGNRGYPAGRDWSTGARIVAATNHVEDGHLDLTAGAMTFQTKACRKPMMVTCPAVFKVVLSKIGRITIERLVETNFPDCGPLFAVICIGPVGK